MQIVLLAGAPGSGKSTQGAALTSLNTKFIHLSVGEIVRQFIADPEHPLTKEYQALISQGQLLPDNVINKVLADELNKIEDKNCIILLDGYPRTRTQYEDFLETWGKPAGLIHLDMDESTLHERMETRSADRADDNHEAIKKRLAFYQQTTKPLLDYIKQDLGKNAITIKTDNSINATCLYLYAKLQRMESIHVILQEKLLLPKEDPQYDPEIRPVGIASLLSQWWQTGIEYDSIRGLQQSYQTQNFSFSFLNTKVVYLETPKEVKTVLNANSHLGHVYKHFSIGANLKYDFVATDMSDSAWKLIHQAFGQTIKNDRKRIQFLIDKHLDKTFFSRKTFELDKTFDTFISEFWAEYLFGTTVSMEQYLPNRDALLSAMKYSFYTNYYKSLDPLGLTSWFYRQFVHRDVTGVKSNIKTFIENASHESAIKRFEAALVELNKNKTLALDDNEIEKIINDCAFDLILEPDFLQNVMYEAMAFAVRENADLHQATIRTKIYEQGMQQGYLFPVRTRVLDEPVVLPDGNLLSSGSSVWINLKQAGVYHSAGPRQCLGQAYAHYFKEHFFNRLQCIEFKVKKVTEPLERQSGNENVPNTAERYLVSWHLKRDEAMRYMTSHSYKGNTFFDVLGLHQNADLDSLMSKQFMFKIKNYVEQQHLDWQNMVIATLEVRGIPIAAQVANRLQIPLYIIRKQGGYKMSEVDVHWETFKKGYGDADTIELPLDTIRSLADKQVIFLDDGLASGESAKACIRLLEKPVSKDKNPARICMVLALLKHDYVKTIPKFSEHVLVKTLFDCHSKVATQLMPENNRQIKNTCN